MYKVKKCVIQNTASIVTRDDVDDDAEMTASAIVALGELAGEPVTFVAATEAVAHVVPLVRFHKGEGNGAKLVVSLDGSELKVIDRFDRNDLQAAVLSAALMASREALGSDGRSGDKEVVDDLTQTSGDGNCEVGDDDVGLFVLINVGCSDHELLG
ncbi:hypothetical protein Q1695_013451 [Nippostrongylus brasiliensis]|nr:hypothetical protein Q1695_013451 [Nippostrongylus brasiliensis]